MNRMLIAGNWKMNGLRADLQVVRDIAAGIDPSNSAPEALLCLPATLLGEASRELASAPLKIGGQTCHAAEKGAYTGDVSALMLQELGASYVIVGHSERRTAHGETDAVVGAQAKAAIKAGLKPIVCVGETLEQRTSGDTLAVIGSQIERSLEGLTVESGLVVAYEPLWAIGTGRVATPDQILEVHGFVRQRLVAGLGATAATVRILYGGSLNPGNAAEILPIPDVDGGLIGGASLKAADFLAIYQTAASLEQ